VKLEVTTVNGDLTPSPNGRRIEPVCVEPAEHALYVRGMHGATAELASTRGVILLYQNSAMRRLVAAEPEWEPQHWVSGDLRTLKHARGTVAVCGGFGIGSPATALIAEQLIALGARRIIAIGTAGTLQADLAIGDRVLCERAVRAEGVSGHYWEPEKYAYASSELTDKFKETLRRCGTSVSTGTSWTTDAPYRETRREADEHATEGVLTVEMEAASLFTVCRYRNVECAAAFSISDSLVRGRRRPMERSGTTADSLDILIRNAVTTLLG
jgi:uridine phosphorylase